MPGKLDRLIQAVALLHEAAPAEHLIQLTQRGEFLELVRWGQVTAVGVLVPGVTMGPDLSVRQSWWKNFHLFTYREEKVSTGQFLGAEKFEWTDKGIHVDGVFCYPMPAAPACPFEQSDLFEMDAMVQDDQGVFFRRELVRKRTFLEDLP